MMLGCSDFGKQAITGSVELENQPLAEGSITFEPKEKGLRPEGTDIRNGNYTLKIMPGKYAVKIRATKKVPVAPGEPTASGEKEKLVSIIPDKYNDATTLTATVSSTETRHDFKLSAK